MAPETGRTLQLLTPTQLPVNERSSRPFAQRQKGLGKLALNSGLFACSTFIMEQDSARADNVCNKKVTIDEVEMHAGINVMPNLSSTIQAPIEQSYGGLKSQLGS